MNATTGCRLTFTERAPLFGAEQDMERHSRGDRILGGEGDEPLRLGPLLHPQPAAPLAAAARTSGPESLPPHPRAAPEVAEHLPDRFRTALLITQSRGSGPRESGTIPPPNTRADTVCRGQCPRSAAPDRPPRARCTAGRGSRPSLRSARTS